MGPGDLSDMSSTNNNQALSLPKLRGDSSNWATYSKRILNYLTSKGYRRHVLNTARKPETLVKRNGSLYKPGSLAPLTDEELEKHKETVDTYNQMQAAVREVIYRTVDKTCKVGIRRGRNGATEYARRRENAGKRKCGRCGEAEMRKARESGNAEGADMRKAECDRIVGRWMNGRGVTERRTDGRKEGRTEGRTDRRKEGRTERIAQV